MMEATSLNGHLTPVPAPSELPSKPPIPTTASVSQDYQYRLAEIFSRATLQDPLNVLFQREKTGPHTPVTSTQLYDGCMVRIKAKTAAGAFIVEAADFAAVACWQPPQSITQDLPEERIQEIAKQGRPVFAIFQRDLQNARREVFEGHGQFWSLSLMARDPNRKDKGAVRAVIEPYVARARREGMPLWLVAANERARDVYAYFGFRVVKVLKSFSSDQRIRSDDGLGDEHEQIVETWCMVANWPPEKVD